MQTQTAIPVTYAKPASVAFLLGASDGDAGHYCLPEIYFVNREQMLKYIEGYEAAVGETMLSKQRKELWGAK